MCLLSIARAVVAVRAVKVVCVCNIIVVSAFLFLVIYVRKQIAGGDVSCDVAY